MRKALLILFICWISLAGRGLAQIDSLLSLGGDNTVLYEQYAHRPGFTVAQLIHFPLDTNIFVNCLLIETDNDSIDSVFGIELDLDLIELKAKYERGAISVFKAKYNLREAPPTDEKGKVDIPNSSYVLSELGLRRYWIFYCKSLKEQSIIYMAWLNKVDKNVFPRAPTQ